MNYVCLFFLSLLLIWRYFLSTLVSDDYFTEPIIVSLPRFSIAFSIGARCLRVAASCTDSRQDCGFSAANSSFSQTGSAHWSMLTRPWNDLDEAFTIRGDIAFPSEGLFTMRHSFRLNAHTISRSFEPIVVIEI